MTPKCSQSRRCHPQKRRRREVMLARVMLIVIRRRAFLAVR
jgi:hypothetical protein